MAKRILTLLILMCLAVSACSADASSDPLLEKALRISKDSTELIKMSEDDIVDIIGIEPEYFTDYAYLTGKDTSVGRELIILRATDEDAAKLVVSRLESYREQRMRCTRNYYALAYRALSESEVLQDSLLIVLSVGSPDPKEPQLLLQEG
ncbi:MAG: DUF4358 domain-containing protein [Clostridia bacterium]|nr:DUF4358 domain-containing protein [Clostridia bacterium]